MRIILLIVAVIAGLVPASAATAAVPMTSVSMTIVDAAGTPLAGANFSVVYDFGDHVEVTTGGDGKLTASVRSRGGELQFHDLDAAAGWFVERVPVGVATDVGTIRWERSGAFTGTATAQPSGSRIVSLVDHAGREIAGAFTSVGSYRIGLLPTEAVTIRARDSQQSWVYLGGSASFSGARFVEAVAGQPRADVLRVVPFGASLRLELAQPSSHARLTELAICAVGGSELDCVYVVRTAGVRLVHRLPAGTVTISASGHATGRAYFRGAGLAAAIHARRASAIRLIDGHTRRVGEFRVPVSSWANGFA